LVGEIFRLKLYDDRNDISYIGEASDIQDKQQYRRLLREGELENETIEIDVPVKSSTEKGTTIAFDANNFAGDQLFRALHKSDKKHEKKKMTISEARPILEEIESEKLLENYDVIKEAIQSVEENGIVFIDEIDKLVSSSDYRGADASSEGVQRDLLPLIEGSAISTKHGNVNTDFILFIASGAFHSSKPSGQ
jgi:ATP-dependent HslUV protease ATP-binding subunit HslU